MNQVFQTKTHLHFGATIYISCLSENTKFYMYSNGISFKSVLGISESQSPYDPSRCLFVVKPVIKFQSENFLERILGNRYNQQALGIDYDEKKTKAFIDQFEFQLNQNIKLQQQQINFPLKYNENFMLQHVFSSNYLGFFKNADSNQYGLCLSQIPSSSCVFNLKACFNYQKDINTYIPFNSATFLNIKFQQGLHNHEMNINFLANSMFDSWMFSEESQDKIRIQLYQTGEEVQYKNIRFGDTIWVFHLESSSFIKVVDEERYSPSIILKKIKYTLGYSSDQAVKSSDQMKAKIMLQKVQNQMSAQKFGLWQILPVLVKDSNNPTAQKGKFMGGKVKFGQQVRFLNVKYKAYLGVRRIKKGRNKFDYQYSIEENEEQNTIFTIKSLSSNSAFITTEDLFLIKNVSSGTYFSLTSPFGINQIQTFLSPSVSYKKQDNFKFTKVDFLELWQNNYLLSIIPFISQGVKALERMKQDMINPRDEVMLRLMCENLTELLSFSFDLTQGFEASENKLGKMTYNHYQIQKLLKDQGIIAKMIQILDKIDPKFLTQMISEKKKAPLKMNGIINIVKKYGISTKEVSLELKKVDSSLLQKIVNTSLKILRNCCKSNTDNSILLFKNSSVIFKFLALETYAENFVIDSFSNQIILEKIGADDFKAIIDQYIKIYKLTNIKSQKIFLVLSKLIKYQDAGIGKNQLEVYRLFFYKGNPLMTPIEQADHQFFVNGIELRQFCQQFPEHADMLGHQIKFCAEITSNRNYICSKTIKQWFPLSTIIKYLITDPISNLKIKQSFTWIIIHSYLNQRPRFKRITPLVFSIPYNPNSRAEQAQQSLTSNFEVQMQVMKDEGLSASIIQDIYSCIQQGDQMTENDLIQLKKFVIDRIEKYSDQTGDSEMFYTSKMQAYIICLKYLVELSVFKQDEIEKIQRIVEQIAKKVDGSLNLKKDGIQKLQSSNFRQLLLQMVEKNVIKKFNYAANFDGVEDEVSSDNICSIFVNYSFYQNILLEQKDSQRRKQTDSVIKIVLELIEVYGQIKTSQKIKIFIEELSKRYNTAKKSDNRVQLIKEVIIENILEQNQSKIQIFNLLTLLFYNSNTYSINSISLNRLLAQVFADRLSMEKISQLQFNVDEKEREEFIEIQKTCKSIKLLMETSEIWLNAFDIVKHKQSKYDTVTLLFIGKIKQLIKTLMPSFDENENDPLFCCKYAKSIIAEKQQIIANLKIHEELIDFISQYRSLMLKIKAGTVTSYNKLLIPMFKFCFLFLFAFIYDSPENKNLLHAIMKQSYLRDYTSYVDKMELGQTVLIIQYLKNNYEECIEFYSKNPEIFQKHHKFTAIHSKLLLTVLNFYDEPILVNLRKFYITIFDFISFKNFLWFKPNGTQLNLDITLYDAENNSRQPYLYHIHAIQVILKVTSHIQESRNTIRQHVRKSLSQEYLYSLLFLDDFYTKENSNSSMLRVMVYFKAAVMKLIQFVYFGEDVKNQSLILNQFRRMNGLLTTLINEAPARQENEDFKKVILIRDTKQQPSNKKIKELYENNLNLNKGEHILETYLNSIDQFCLDYKKINIKSKENMTEKMVLASEDIHRKVVGVYEILHKNLRDYEDQKEEDSVQKYPVPYEWLFSLSGSDRDEDSLQKKRFFSSFLIQSIFSQQIYKKFRQNQKKLIKTFLQSLQKINIKPFLVLRKLAEYIQDAFQKLSNHPTPEMYKSINMLIRFITLWIQCSTPERANELRNQIGKAELIFPILNFFEICTFDKLNKEIFLTCLEFFNELIGQEGHKSIQTIFNQYFTNKADSIQFFMKIKQLFDAINFEDRVNYKCKKIYESMQQMSRDTMLESSSQFTILNFLIRLCKGNFRDNQIFLSSLSNVSNFNIMSGIWEILKHQSQKYKKNLINVENYRLITQCFSTIRQLVEGPCVQNQNEFLKRDFFLTVLQFFQFEATGADLTLETFLEERLKDIQKISPKFTEKLRIYLNRDKITDSWMPSQVKYRCISLICSLLSENVSEESKSQLYALSPKLIIKQIDKVYQRYIEQGLQYNHENLQTKQDTEIVLPLGFKLYELLQYYPPQKIQQNTPGLEFFRDNSRIVQVLHQKLSIVVFPRIAQQISSAFKTKFIYQVDRSSVNSKLRGLQDAQIQNKQSDYPYGYILFCLICIITILDILIYNQVSLPFIQRFAFYPIFRFYGVNYAEQLVVSILIILSMMCSLIFLIFQIRGAVYFRQHISSMYNSGQLTKFQKFKQITLFIWNNLTYFHYLITLFLCFLTIFNPFFDAILLLVELYRRSETFSAIVDAITATLDQLLVVLLFTLICTYVLTTFLYYYRAAKNYPNQCSNLYHCFVFALDLGFRQDAGIAGYNDDSDTILQQFYTEPIQDVVVNFIYLFIIKMIIQQIIGAIIVDKFAALRENKEKLQQDEESFCFICGLGRTLLDREEDGFQYHKQNYHNMWNYFEFLSYLRKSKLSSLSGIQLFVYDQQKNGKLNWFPISRSYHLEMKNQQSNDKQEEENELEKMMKAFDLQVNDLRDEITHIWNLLNIKLSKEQSNMKQQR